MVTNAQSVEAIKSSNNYLSGEGWDETLREADNAALQDLISKISVNVQSSFTTSETEFNDNGKLDSKATARSIVNSYSEATLTNTQRIVIDNEPNAHVLRFIKTAELNRIFESRKAKVLDMVRMAQRAESQGKIDDALRYYYWSYCLLKSLQYSNEVKYADALGQSHMLSIWIPAQMNDIFSNIRIHKKSQVGDVVNLSISYKGKPVTSLDYTYFDGMDWSNIYSARDGMGIVELRPGQTATNLRVKCEYEFAGQSHIDHEIASVMNMMKGTSFRDAYIMPDGIATKSNAMDFAKVSRMESSSSTTAAMDVKNADAYMHIVESLCKGIQQKNYQAIRQYFTSEGWSIFQKLIHYGNSAVVNNPTCTFTRLGDKVICRSIPMSFSFRNNKRKFVEEVSLVFNSNKKIEELNFGLGKTATDDIMQKGVWSNESRLILINFLEEYKTAYALKDLDFIRKVFDNNAVIITGRVTRRPANSIEGQPYINSPIIKFNRQTKDEYIKNLEHCFASNEFINIRFANNDILKSGKGGETYGIQIKQDYYSSTYGDTGYLFLMVDVNDPDKPIIKVRT